jgi:hypothetical protein
VGQDASSIAQLGQAKSVFHVGLDVRELQRDLPCPEIVVPKPKTLALAMVELALRRAAPMADRRIIWSSIQQIDVVRPAAVAVSPAIPRPC